MLALVLQQELICCGDGRAMWHNSNSEKMARKVRKEARVYGVMSHIKFRVPLV